MATVDNQQSWLPYDATTGRDCSQGFCSIYCPQWCYLLFSPPPPLSLAAAAAAGDNATTFSPLVIAIIAILASALLLVSYHTFASRNCASLSFLRRPIHFEESAVGGGGAAAATAVRHHASPSNGLEESLINKIAFLRYKREEGIVDGTDCSVCLGEFQEEESLRLLPKCGHAFHLQCIDTWLKSHANCPLCRASIVMEPDEHEEAMVMNIEEAGRSREEEDTGEEDAEPVRRCLSAGSFLAYRGRVSIADALQMSMEEEYMVAKSCGLVGEGGRWRRSEGEENRGKGRNRGLNCVVRTVRMKRSVSSGRFFYGREGRGRSFLLPV